MSLDHSPLVEFIFFKFRTLFVVADGAKLEFSSKEVALLSVFLFNTMRSQAAVFLPFMDFPLLDNRYMFEMSCLFTSSLHLVQK